MEEQRMPRQLSAEREREKTPWQLSAERERKRFRNTVQSIKSTLFFVFLFVMAFIGLLWFARPSVSTVEKRELTKFPKLTASGFWDGSWFSGIDTWYADTYPLREMLISMNSDMQSLYGFRSEQLVGGGTQVAEEIPEGSVNLEELAAQTEATEAIEVPTETEEVEGRGDVVTPAETAGTVYITEHCAYGVFYFTQRTSAKYCLMMNNLAEKCRGLANVYCMAVPTSTGIMLSDEVREGIGCSDENEAMEWMYSQMSKEVKTVPVYHALKAHNDEYIYFHTDHHWTALGAYYGYCEFCSAKGIKPHELSRFETYEFSDFKGTYYYSSNQSPELDSNLDTVTAYIPNGTNLMTTQMPNGDGTYTEYQWPLVNDVSAYDKSQLYSCFSGGDQPFNYAHNKNLKDGSAVLIVKDSYANVLIPFLVDHYEHIYWIDYRYYGDYCDFVGKSDRSVSALVKEKSINDVIVINSTSSTSSGTFFSEMEELYQ